MYPYLDFHYNWNGKLSCNSFTTIRLHNPAKYFVGQVFEVRLNKSTFGFYRVHQVKSITLPQISDWIALLDTGYDAEKTREILRGMYRDKPGINIESHPLDYILLLRV